MNRTKRCIVFILLLLISVAHLKSQDVQEDNVYRIITRQGNEFIGTVVSENQDVIVLKTTAFGEVTIRKEDIRRQVIISADRFKDGEFWPDNPQSTRYLWTPNGYALEKGEAYYQNIWVLYNQVSLGVTENFSISAGLIPTLLLGAEAMPLWVVPKFSIPIEKNKVNMSAGAFIGTVAGEETGGFGIAFGTLTLGDRDNNVNLGLGWGFADGRWADFPVINLGIMYRVSPRGYFISENYYINLFDEGFGIISAGGRRIIGAVGLDFALAIPLVAGMDRLIALPFLGFTVPLNGKHSRGN